MARVSGGETPSRAEDRSFLREAVRLAARNVESGGGPFAALVVRDGEIVASGTNRVTATNDPTAHAEVQAIRAACARLEDFRLGGCTVYASSEPCPMCMGALYWARPDRVVFAGPRIASASAGFDDGFIYDELARPPDERALPTERVEIPEAGEEFEAWLRYADRVEY